MPSMVVRPPMLGAAAGSVELGRGRLAQFGQSTEELDQPLTQRPASQRRFIGELHVMGQLVEAQMSGGVGSHPCGLGSDSGTTQGA